MVLHFSGSDLICLEGHREFKLMVNFQYLKNLDLEFLKDQ